VEIAQVEGVLFDLSTILAAEMACSDLALDDDYEISRKYYGINTPAQPVQRIFKKY
jgi:hypothetical protein